MSKDNPECLHCILLEALTIHIELNQNASAESLMSLILQFVAEAHVDLVNLGKVSTHAADFALLQTLSVHIYAARRDKSGETPSTPLPNNVIPFHGSKT